MIGNQNFGNTVVPTRDNPLYQVSTLAESQGVPDSEYNGDSFLVCGCHNHFHGNLTLLSECILRFELVDRSDRHHFNVCTTAFRHALTHSSSTLAI